MYEKQSDSQVFTKMCPARRSLEKQIEQEFLKMKIPESYLVWAKKYLQISLDNHTADISEQKNGLQRQLTKLEEKEKVLLKKLLSEVISDEDIQKL
jgi:hypothetical protein